MISAKLVAEYLEYKEGHLRWIKRPPGPTKNIVGNRYGSVDKHGYVCGQLLGRLYKEHRLIWLLHYGELPMYLDHINGDRSDNRIENLRVCTLQQNAFNRKNRAGSTSKYKGVSWHKGKQKWTSRHTFKGKTYNLGDFDNEEDAAKTYNEAVKDFQKEFKRINLID